MMKPASRREFLGKLGIGAVGLVLAGGCDSKRMSFNTGRRHSTDNMPYYDPFSRSGPSPVVAAPRPLPASIAKAQPVKKALNPQAWTVSSSRSWKYIVVHHSATRGGSAAIFHKNHVQSRGWKSLGYHFVIPNGRDAPDGAIEIGPRWRSQQTGAHTKTAGNEYNAHGIGICLVGDFEKQHPTPAQLRSLDILVADLAHRYGIPAYRILGHRDAPGTNTNCPGRHLHGYVRSNLRQKV